MPIEPVFLERVLDLIRRPPWKYVFQTPSEFYHLAVRRSVVYHTGAQLQLPRRVNQGTRAGGRKTVYRGDAMKLDIELWSAVQRLVEARLLVPKTPGQYIDMSVNHLLDLCKTNELPATLEGFYLVGFNEVLMLELALRRDSGHEFEELWNHFVDEWDEGRKEGRGRAQRIRVGQIGRNRRERTVNQDSILEALHDAIYNSMTGPKLP